MISAGIPTIPIIIYARPRNIQKCISHLNIEDESLGDSKMTHTHKKKQKGSFRETNYRTIQDSHLFFLLHLVYN